MAVMFTAKRTTSGAGATAIPVGVLSPIYIYIYIYIYMYIYMYIYIEYYVYRMYIEVPTRGHGMGHRWV